MLNREQIFFFNMDQVFGVQKLVTKYIFIGSLKKMT